MDKLKRVLLLILFVITTLCVQTYIFVCAGANDRVARSKHSLRIRKFGAPVLGITLCDTETYRNEAAKKHHMYMLKMVWLTLNWGIVSYIYYAFI